MEKCNCCKRGTDNRSVICSECMSTVKDYWEYRADSDWRIMCNFCYYKTRNKIVREKGDENE